VLTDGLRFTRGEREAHLECAPLRLRQLGKHACNVVREKIT
jgi:hypothetical protein